MGTVLLTLGLAAAVTIAGTVVVRRVHEGFDRRLEGLDGRLLSSQQSAGQTATQIVERLGKLDGTAAQMLQKAADLGRLEQALRPPKARGGVGEMLLANLLRDMLPPDAYRLQHTFRSGERVDAVVRVDKLVIPVSPSTFHAYLLMVTQGLRALQIERHAQDVMAFCAQLGKDFERFRGDFEVVGKHIGNAQSKYSEASGRLTRLEATLERATEWEPEEAEHVEVAEAKELPRALDAA